MQNKDGWEKRFLYAFPFSLAVEEMRGRPRRKATLLSAATSGSRLHPSSPPAAGPLARSAADYDRAAWSRQHAAVTRLVPFTLARWTRGTGAGAFPLAPPTICQHADRDWKASGESCVRRWAGVAQRADPWLHIQTASQRKAGRDGDHQKMCVCAMCLTRKRFKLTQTENGEAWRALGYGGQVLRIWIFWCSFLFLSFTNFNSAEVVEPQKSVTRKVLLLSFIKKNGEMIQKGCGLEWDKIKVPPFLELVNNY